MNLSETYLKSEIMMKNFGGPKIMGDETLLSGALKIALQEVLDKNFFGNTEALSALASLFESYLTLREKSE